MIKKLKRCKIMSWEHVKREVERKGITVERIMCFSKDFVNENKSRIIWTQGGGDYEFKNSNGENVWDLVSTDNDKINLILKTCKKLNVKKIAIRKATCAGAFRIYYLKD